MTLAAIRTYCLSLPGTDEDMPFGPDALVLRVVGKAFCLMGTSPTENSMNLKCDPERALELRAAHPEITPGYHMNKKHWNTVRIDGALSDPMLQELIRHSYDCVVAKLTRQERQTLQALTQTVSGTSAATQAEATGSF